MAFLRGNGCAKMEGGLALLERFFAIWNARISFYMYTESLGVVLTGVLSRKLVLSTLGGVLSTPYRAISGLMTLRTRSSALIDASDEG